MDTQGVFAHGTQSITFTLSCFATEYVIIWNMEKMRQILQVFLHNMTLAAVCHSQSVMFVDCSIDYTTASRGS